MKKATKRLNKPFGELAKSVKDFGPIELPLRLEADVVAWLCRAAGNNDCKTGRELAEKIINEAAFGRR